MRLLLREWTSQKMKTESKIIKNKYRLPKYRLPRKLKKKCSKDLILAGRLPKVRKRIIRMVEFANVRILPTLLANGIVTNL